MKKILSLLVTCLISCSPHQELKDEEKFKNLIADYLLYSILYDTTFPDVAGSIMGSWISDEEFVVDGMHFRKAIQINQTQIKLTNICQLDKELISTALDSKILKYEGDHIQVEKPSAKKSFFKINNQRPCQVEFPAEVVRARLENNSFAFANDTTTRWIRTEKIKPASTDIPPTSTPIPEPTPTPEPIPWPTQTPQPDPTPTPDSVETPTPAPTPELTAKDLIKGIWVYDSGVGAGQVAHMVELTVGENSVEKHLTCTMMSIVGILISTSIELKVDATVTDTNIEILETKEIKSPLVTDEGFQADCEIKFQAGENFPYAVSESGTKASIRDRSYPAQEIEMKRMQ